MLKGLKDGLFFIKQKTTFLNFKFISNSNRKS